jgi:hypothetical protein
MYGFVPQSNMEYQLGYDDATYAKEMDEVNYPQIRQFKVNRALLDGPKDDLPEVPGNQLTQKTYGLFLQLPIFLRRIV